MTRIEKKFGELGRSNRKAFIAYITAGDPSWKKTKEITFALDKAGVDILELGIPFSDPMADGPVIQRASERALKGGTTLKKVLEGLKEIRRHSDIPILLFTYFNPVHRMGLAAFAKAAKNSGADGALITDLTPESAGEYKKIMRKAGLNTVFLAAPTTPVDRLKKIARLSSGFIYYISRTGVTGMHDTLEKTVSQKVKQIKKLSSLPVAVGFGISTPEHVASIARYADGVVVGSALVKSIEETHGNACKVEKLAGRLIMPLKAQSAK